MIFALLANRGATVFTEAIMDNTEHIKVLKLFLEVTACALLGLQNCNLLYIKKTIANIASHTQLLKFIYCV